MDPAVVIAIIGGVFTGVGTLIGLFIKYIQGRDKSQERRDEIFAKALGENTKAMKSVADATKKSAQEAKERNGHLAELAIENNANNLNANRAILDAIKSLPTQHINKQIVDQQTVKENTHEL